MFLRNNEKKHFWKNNIWILSLVAKYIPNAFVFQSVKVILSVLTVYINVNFTRWIIDCITENISITPVISFICLISAIFILCNLLLSIYNIILRPQQEIELGHKIREKVIDKVSKIDQIEFQKNEFYNRYTLGLKEIDTRAIAVLNNAFQMITATFEFVILSFVSSRISGGFALFGVIAAIIDVSLGLFRNKINYRQTLAVTSDARKRGYINRIIYQQEFISDQKLYVNFPKLLKEQYYKTTSNVKKIILSYAKKIILLDQSQQIPGYLLRQTLPWVFIAILLFTGNITFSEVTVLSAAALSIPSSLTRLLNGISTFHSQSMYVENLKNILEYPEKNELDKEDALEIPNKFDINIKNISFSYDMDERKIIDDVSIDIPYGRKIALVGSNGSGKSTLIKLIVKLYNVESGEIQINGINIDNYKIKSLRSKIALLNQDSRIYSFSIAENILMRPLLTENDTKLVQIALEKVGLWSKVQRFPKGINTFVTREFDEYGEYFSGGELQKLVLARIYANDYSCIIMDESTSALDPVSEDEIIKTIINTFSDKTIIFISHRLGIVNSVDCVYYFAEGKLQDYGNHTKMMQKNGAYADFYLKQANKYS